MYLLKSSQLTEGEIRKSALKGSVLSKPSLSLRCRSIAFSCYSIKHHLRVDPDSCKCVWYTVAFFCCLLPSFWAKQWSWTSKMIKPYFYLVIFCLKFDIKVSTSPANDMLWCIFALWMWQAEIHWQQWNSQITCRVRNAIVRQTDGIFIGRT